MLRAMTVWGTTGWTPLDVASREAKLDVTPSPIFKHTSFNDCYSDRDIMMASDVDIGQVAFLRQEHNDDCREFAWAHGDLLDAHPIASRSFATIPPVPRIAFFDLENFNEDTSNRGGVTVKDLLAGVGNMCVPTAVLRSNPEVDLFQFDKADGHSGACALPGASEGRAGT